MKKGTIIFLILALLLMLVSSLTVTAQDSIEIRFTCYQDGNECDTYSDLLDTFMADNPNITVTIDKVAYQDILDSLPVNVQVGEGPDIARLTNFTQLRDYYLDMRPFLKDPSVFDDNFNPAILAAFRVNGEGDALSGFPDAITSTGPFVNATLFEQAGVDMPGEGATWDDWGTALQQVVDATGVDYGFAIDNRGHRFAGPAMSMGAQFFDADGNFNFTDGNDQGFTDFAQLLKGWLDSGFSPKETWATGDTYTAADQYFINAQTVMYFSGSWQVSAFATKIGDAFDWVVAPNPTGPGGSTGVAGGAGLVAFDSHDDAKNAAISAVMEYLAQPDVYAEFSGKTLNIPASSGAIDAGVTYDTDNPQVKAALAQFAIEGTKFQPQAIELNINPLAFAYYAASNTRLQQYFFGEIQLSDLLQRIQDDIDAAAANAAAGS